MGVFFCVLYTKNSFRNNSRMLFVLASGDFSLSESGEKNQSESNEMNQSPGFVLLN